MEQYRRPDGSYVVVIDGFPSHILPENPLFEEGIRDSLPLRPDGDTEWNGSAWVEIVPDPEDILVQKRAGAVLSRSQFIQAAYVAGLITKSEAISVAAPAFFETALAALVTNGSITQQEADLSEILWANLVQVERNHPLLPVAQGALGLTDEEVDTLFGIS